MKKELPKKIWIYWGQGWEPQKLPPLQKDVLHSWSFHNQDWELVLISDANIKDYLPNEVDYIFDNSKEISYQAKSDILRLSLLNKYGGIWADSTMLCLQSLNTWIFEAVNISGIWMYHGYGGGFDINKGLCSWFIASLPGNYMIKKWKESCDKYWEDRKKEHTYFWMDYLFKELYYSDWEVWGIWRATPNICAEDYGQAHCMVNNLLNNDPKLKSHIEQYPPYVIKFWNYWNNYINDKNITESNGYFVIKQSQKQNTFKHQFKK